MTRFFSTIFLFLFFLNLGVIKTADACFWCGYTNVGGYVVSASPPIVASPPAVYYPYFNYGYNGGYNYIINYPVYPVLNSYNPYHSSYSNWVNHNYLLRY